MGKMKCSFFLVGVGILIYASLAYSLDVRTHEAINERIALDNFDKFSLAGFLDGVSLRDYLTNNLGFTDGVLETIWNEQIGQEEAVWEWIRDGGRYEDRPPGAAISILGINLPNPPYLRSTNHFHNPITKKGFSGFFFGLVLSGESSKDWAEEAPGQQRCYLGVPCGGYYSWLDARQYFLQCPRLRPTKQTGRRILLKRSGPWGS